jgi:hypothetical protein
MMEKDLFGIGQREAFNRDGPFQGFVSCACCIATQSSYKPSGRWVIN